MKVKPLKNYLLVKPVKKGNETKSGIILVGEEQTETKVVQIIETADSYDEEKEILLKGDKLLINPQEGTRVEMDSDEYLIIHQRDVYAIIKD